MNCGHYPAQHQRLSQVAKTGVKKGAPLLSRNSASPYFSSTPSLHTLPPPPPRLSSRPSLNNNPNSSLLTHSSSSRLPPSSPNAFPLPSPNALPPLSPNAPNSGSNKIESGKSQREEKKIERGGGRESGRGGGEERRSYTVPEHSIDEEHLWSLDCRFKLAYLTPNNTESRVKAIKVCFLGDCSSGKSSVVKALMGKESFSPSYFPTKFEIHKTEIDVPGLKVLPLEYWDCNGGSKYDHKRPLLYPNTNCFVLCVDLTNVESWRSAMKRWLPEITTMSRYPLILVGTKVDLIGANSGHSCVPTIEITSHLDSEYSHFKIAKLLSVSSSTHQGIDKLREVIVYSTLYDPQTGMNSSEGPDVILQRATEGATKLYKKIKKEIKRKII